MSGRSSRFPFTAAQWQELEHQALIFKYMVSGIPVPPDLLYTIKRSSLDSPFISRLFPQHYPDVGWNYLQMGSGRKIDPEPGRCRRTDGKKWRCSKEAYPDSKYCERHMHRGKNRSRKPVEVLKTTTTTTPTTPATALNSNPSTPAISSITQNSALSSLPSDPHNHNHSCFNTHSPHPFLYQHGSSSSRPPGSALHQNSNTSMLFDNPDYRYVYGLKEDGDEHPFLSEEHSGNMRGFSASSLEDSWQLTPLTMSCSSSSSRHKNCSALQGDYSSYLQLQSFGDSPKQLKQEEHYYEMQNKMGREEPQKIMHHFFDEWSPKDRESWLDLDDKSSNTGSVSATRLSMSISNNSLQHDFSSIFNSNKHNEN
ncbi:growth-regulating factor 5-like isoform X2 [Momordica charantia]|uniref:Growth-regulating factor n=1 Tax=Momordica charantia TaxID=3673 RepID=A0A6J1DMB1_MOMCH|nr:growth-regulating factor 5-like isoform X2 [Momordica charantia]